MSGRNGHTSCCSDMTPSSDNTETTQYPARCNGARHIGSCQSSGTFTFSATANDGRTAEGSFLGALNQTAIVELADDEPFMYDCYDSDK